MMAAPGLAARPGRRHGRATLGLPAQLQRDRQGVHRRAGLRRRRCRDGGGISGVLLNIGGDLRVRGDIARTIGIASPWADSESTEPLRLHRGQGPVGRHQRQLAARAVGSAASGTRTSSIPDRGCRSSASSSATVVAERAADADALAKVCNVLAPEEGLRLVRFAAGGRMPDRREGRPGSAQRRLAAPGAAAAGCAGPRRRRKQACRRAKEGELGKARRTHRRPPSPGTRNTSWSSTFEINQPDAEKGRYRRPYVAVWVEDKDGLSGPDAVALGLDGRIRAVSVAPRPEAVVSRATRTASASTRRSCFFTVSRPTRQPGKYKVIWDGKDDHGKPLPAASTRSPSRPPASTGRIRASASR